MCKYKYYLIKYLVVFMTVVHTYIYIQIYCSLQVSFCRVQKFCAYYYMKRYFLENVGRLFIFVRKHNRQRIPVLLA
jgi:hypothetical protein